MVYLFLFLIIIGIPIAISLGLVPLIYFIVSGKYSLSMFSYKIYDALDNYSLIAVPLFIFSGNLIGKIGLTEKLVEFSNELVGRMKGGMSHANVVASTLFGGLNGSAVADASVVGSILIGPMKKAGFSGAYSAAVTACSGTISAIIPPSVPFIIFASVVPDISVGALLIGGIIPGILISIFQCVAGYIVSHFKKYPRSTEPFSVGKFFKTAINTFPAIILVLIIIVGLRGGIFTPTEVAAIIVFYALILGIIYRRLNLNILLEVLYETTITTGTIFFIIACAGPFMWILTRIGVISSITEMVVGISNNPIIWWLVIIPFVLIAGMVMDTTANILIIGPILYDSAVHLGFNPLSTSIAIVLLLLIGIQTPPVGISLFVTAAIAEERIESVSLMAIPFILAELLVFIMLIVFPDLFTYLPRILGYEV